MSSQPPCPLRSSEVSPVPVLMLVSIFLAPEVGPRSLDDSRGPPSSRLALSSSDHSAEDNWSQHKGSSKHQAGRDSRRSSGSSHLCRRELDHLLVSKSWRTNLYCNYFTDCSSCFSGPASCSIGYGSRFVWILASCSDGIYQGYDYGGYSGVDCKLPVSSCSSAVAVLPSCLSSIFLCHRSGQPLLSIWCLLGLLQGSLLLLLTVFRLLPRLCTSCLTHACLQVTSDRRRTLLDLRPREVFSSRLMRHMKLWLTPTTGPLCLRHCGN